MRSTVLKNGFTIYTKSIDVAQAVTFSIYVKSGSYQEEEPFGAAHLLEHMVFKGTKTRTTQQISEDVEKYGGVMNAETSFEHTRYYTIIPFENWENGADVVYDICFNSIIPEKEFVLEKKVVQEELKMYSDDSSSHVNDMLLQSMFKSYPNRQTLGGTVDSVENITIQQLVDFRDKKYKPDNMFAVVTGNIKHEDVVGFFVKKMESEETEKSVVDLRTNKFKHDILNSKTINKTRDIEQAHLSWGLFVSSENDKEAPVLEVISTILGGSSTSRLYKIVREEMGLAYTISAYYMGLSDTGLIVGYAGLEKSKIKEVKDIVVEQFYNLKNKLVADEELERVKNYILGKHKMRLDNLSSINSYIGSSIVTNTPIDPDDFVKKIEGVTKEDIKRISKKYFIKENWQFAEINPKNN